MSEPQQHPVVPSSAQSPEQQRSPAPAPAPPAPAPPAASPLPADPQLPADQQFPAAAAPHGVAAHPQTPPPYAGASQYPAGQPPYPSGQQQYPTGQQHYPAAQPQYPGPGQTATGPRNPLARVALIVALATFAVGLVISLFTPFAYRALDYSGAGLGVINALSGLVALGGSAAALILGIIAARRPGPRLLAGIAIGIAGTQIAGVVVGWFSSLFYTFL